MPPSTNDTDNSFVDGNIMLTACDGQQCASISAKEQVILYYAASVHLHLDIQQQNQLLVPVQPLQHNHLPEPQQHSHLPEPQQHSHPPEQHSHPPEQHSHLPKPQQRR